MNFVESIKISLYKYVDFSSRSSRAELGYFILFSLLLIIVSEILDQAIVGKTNTFDGNYGPAYLIINLFITLPSFSLCVRRLHDINKSGWWILLSFTIIGLIPLFYWWFKEGDESNNDYGEDPLFELRKNNKIKKISKLVKYFLIVPILIILSVLVLFGLLMETGFLPDTKVYKENDIAEGTKTELINHKIIDKNDTIRFFYSEGFISIMEGGQLITNDQLIVYEKNEKGIIETSKMFLKNISKVVVDKKGDVFSDNIFKIIGNNNAKYDSMSIYLPFKSDENSDFIKALKSQ